MRALIILNKLLKLLHQPGKFKFYLINFLPSLFKLFLSLNFLLFKLLVVSSKRDTLVLNFWDILRLVHVLKVVDQLVSNHYGLHLIIQLHEWHHLPLRLALTVWDRFVLDKKTIKLFVNLSLKQAICCVDIFFFRNNLFACIFLKR